MLEIKVCDSITRLVEKLATSGKEEVDKKGFKELVRFSGQSEEYLKFTLERIFHHLEQKHSEIRLGAFLIVDELFRRSQYFREILLDDFHTFLELTVESDPNKLLPPPLNVAKTLKQKVLQAIHKWYSTFGEDHKRLALSYNFLKNNLKVDFQDALKRNAGELQAVRREQERQAKVVEKKVSSMKNEINEHQDEIMRVVTEMDNCFCLLIPKPEDTFGVVESQNDEENGDLSGKEIDLREHGFQNVSTTISINLGKDQLDRVEENEDNAAIIENLKDFNALLKNRFSVMIKKWVVVSSKSADQSLFRKVMDLKRMVDNQVQRFNKIKLSASKNTQADKESDSDEDSDSDFEEVPEKEGFEAEVSSPPVQPPASSKDSTNFASKSCTSSQKAGTSWKLWDVKKDDAKDPTTLLATLTAINTKKNETSSSSASISHQQPSSSSSVKETRKEKLLKVAPKLPFDVDLYHWEDTDLKAPSIEIVETHGHKFWNSAQDREGEMIDDPNGVAALRTRVIEFSGNFEPVKWSCRVPLPSGTLCPRRDRIKCPLHGKIIGRDNMGNPTNLEDIQELEKAKELLEKTKPPEWQDPQFLKEIQAATGMDLTVKPPKKGKQKKKTFTELYPGLTDIDRKRNTPRSRLEKKVLNKSAIKRVAESMDELSSKRFKDKFGDQWNYSMNND